MAAVASPAFVSGPGLATPVARPCQGPQAAPWQGVKFVCLMAVGKNAGTLVDRRVKRAPAFDPQPYWTIA